MIREIREFYRIPQRLLADYLGISRSQLSMIEMNQRSLSAESSLNLLKFFKAISNSETTKDPEIKQSIKAQDERKKTIVKNKLQEARLRLKMAKDALARLQEEQSRTLKVMTSIFFLRKLSLTKHEESLVSLVEMDAREQQQSSGIDKQLELETEIKRIEAEIRYLESL